MPITTYVIFENAILSSGLVRFWLQIKRNVLPCNYTLLTWYESVSQVCQFNGFVVENMSYLFSSYDQFRNNYSKRRKRLVDKLQQELREYWAEPFNNKPVYSSFSQLDCHSTLKRLKPDLIVKRNHRRNSMPLLFVLGGVICREKCKI